MSKSGYIDLNERKIHTFDVYEHLEFIQENYVHIDSRIEELLQEVNSVRESCESLIEQGEHPEWHCFEMARDDAAHTINTILLNKNILRFHQGHDDNLYIDTFTKMYYENSQKEKIKNLLSNMHFVKVRIYFRDTYKNVDFTYNEFMESV